MAEDVKNEEVVEEEQPSLNKKESKYKRKTEQEEPKQEEPKQEEPEQKKPEPIKPYVHIDTFLQTALPYYGLSRMQAQGFKARMQGKHYQRDEQIFVEELKAYLNLK